MSPKKKQESDYEETEPSDVSLEEEPASEEEYSPKKKKKAPAARKRAAPKRESKTSRLAWARLRRWLAAQGHKTAIEAV